MNMRVFRLAGRDLAIAMMRAKSTGVIAGILLAACLGASPAPSELVGSYYQGDGLGVNWYLRLQDDGTFTFKWEGCLGTYDEQAGGWKIGPDSLVELQVRTRKGGSFGKSLPLSLRPVPWGSRLYLVGSEEGREFCNFINEGTEPRDEAHGLALLRDNDWKRPASGQAQIPQAWHRFLLSAPVRGRIVQAVGVRTAEIDRGARSGLKPGMLVYWQGSEFLPYKVISTTALSAVVETLYDEKTKSSGPVSSLLYDETLRPRCGGQ